MTRASILFVVLAAALAGAVACGPSGPKREGPVSAGRTDGTLPRDEPRAEAWSDAVDREIDMVPQSITQPTLATPSITKIRVRALHDGEWVSFRLEWEDATEDAVSGTGRMSDAIAVQLPSARGAAPPTVMMGHEGEGGRVQILYWRAAWQNPDPMATLYPNRPPGFHPAHALPEGEGRDRLAAPYSPAIAVQNPTIARHEDQPAFRGEAEGFGTLSPAMNREIRAHGEYADGHWYVVLSMPIGDAATSVVAPGQTANVAFAVWDGAAGNIGARKMWSGAWFPLEIAAGGS